MAQVIGRKRQCGASKVATKRGCLRALAPNALLAVNCAQSHTVICPSAEPATNSRRRVLLLLRLLPLLLLFVLEPDAHAIAFVVVLVSAVVDDTSALEFEVVVTAPNDSDDEDDEIDLLSSFDELVLISAWALRSVVGGGASQLPRRDALTARCCSTFILGPPPSRLPLPLLATPLLLLLRVSDKARFTPGKPPVSASPPVAAPPLISRPNPPLPCCFAALSPTAFLRPTLPLSAVADDSATF